MSEGTSLTVPSTEIAIVDEKTIRDKIYTVRGMKVMLDFELAEIYGYSTTAGSSISMIRRHIRPLW